MDELLGPQEVAALFRYSIATVHAYRSTGVLPEPDQIRSGVPLWSLDTLRRWARETGRAARLRPGAR